MGTGGRSDGETRGRGDAERLEHPRVYVSPCLRISASPRLRLPASPYLRVSVSPRLRVSVSPRLRVAVSLRLRVRLGHEHDFADVLSFFEITMRCACLVKRERAIDVGIHPAFFNAAQ